MVYENKQTKIKLNWNLILREKIKKRRTKRLNGTTIRINID